MSPDVIAIFDEGGSLRGLVEPDASGPFLTASELQKMLPAGWHAEVKTAVTAARFKTWLSEKGLAVHGQRLVNS
jgi:hypothetical protein